MLQKASFTNSLLLARQGFQNSHACRSASLVWKREASRGVLSLLEGTYRFLQSKRSSFVPQTELASEGVLADLVTMFLGSLRLGRPTPPRATGGPPSGSRSPQPGARKTWFCLRNGSKIGMRGNPATQMDCMVPRMCLDAPVSPQTLPNHGFCAISQFSGILGRAPGHPLLALCGPIAVSYTHLTLPTNSLV